MQGLQETQFQSLGPEDLLEKGMATHSSILAWKIPWSLEGYNPWGSQRVGPDLVTKQQQQHLHNVHNKNATF